MFLKHNFFQQDRSQGQKKHCQTKISATAVCKINLRKCVFYEFIPEKAATPCIISQNIFLKLYLFTDLLDKKKYYYHLLFSNIIIQLFQLIKVKYFQSKTYLNILITITLNKTLVSFFKAMLIRFHCPLAKENQEES